MYFEDVAIGSETELGSHHFSAEEIKRFAARFDPQPFHMDEAAAARSSFGALAASGWHTTAVMMKLVVAEAERSGRGGARGFSPGVDDLRWIRPVFAGDTISYRSRVTAKRLSQSRPGWGLVTSEMTGTNQKGEPVYSVTGHVFFRTRPA